MKADLELVHDVKEGNIQAYAELVRRHQKALQRLCLRFLGDWGLAEDVVQESLVKAFQKLHLFEEKCSFKSWLFQIAVNTAKNKMRSNRGDRIAIEDVALGTDATAERDLLAESLRKILWAEVHKLPDRQKTALMLRIYEDLSFKEIAEIMECPYDTAKANFRHGLIKLKDVLGARGDLDQWLQTENVFEVNGTYEWAEVEQ